MNRWRAGLSYTGKWAILWAGIVALFILAGFLLPFLARQREEARRTGCTRNFQAIGKALSAYRNDNYGYFPFSWGLADSASKAFNNAAASSLGLLYPKYLKTAELFRCPSTENEPAFVLNGEGASRTWALTGSSYGYDPRVSRIAGKNVVIMADMDGTYTYCRDTATQNHPGGQNVLYVDGHVKWIDSPGPNVVSENPNDNIFAEDPWDADTDTFLVRGDLNDLTISFDGYEHLK